MRWEPKESVAIVTGASSGIGRCLCRRLLRSGASVVANARREERLLELQDSADNASADNAEQRFFPVVGDVTDPTVRQEIIRVAGSIRSGELDLLVNNAGIGALGPFADAEPSRLRRIMEVNFFAPVELTRLALDLLRRGRAPVICNLCSVLGHRAVPDKSEYCASKFAMHGFSDSLRAELAPTGIQVTLVSPSTTESEFFDSLIDTDAGQTSKSIGSWPADRVAKATMSAIRARRSEVICSLGGKALVYADRLSPPIVNAVLKKS
ncbi:SDR family NAD(P)-dependent oxidoreductase [Stieleria varia]|uniref:3-oxoacyl-[acyl-carrier-protein] reductase FabG n=1 Tax=Stieleria varia TaxID=2528005 RepID=A0A5C6AUT5_9BACT|nr:SDR family NAD(P)-dependent oxidoreductase [Stieleria varia]TWU02826.1 3-oxoacyl-[acyl-carrier-protein] reductase FabG [Stieleria varia]